MEDILFLTNRCHVVRLTESHIDVMYEVYGDRESMRWVGDGEPITRDQCVEWVQKTRRNEEKRGYGMCTVQLKESGEIVGFCGLVHPNDQLLPEIKYAYRKKHWGKGFATEIAIGMIEYGARRFFHEEIIATTAPENMESHRVLLKAGMKDAGLISNDDGSKTQVFHWKKQSK